MAEEAYKKGASDFDVTITEKELDNLYSKYCKEPDYEFKKKKIEYNKSNGVANLNFDSSNNPYKLSGLSNAEAIYIQKIYGSKVPKSLQKKSQRKYLKEHNLNISNIHTDFMIGGPNVVVDGITKNGDVIPLIKDCKFQI